MLIAASLVWAMLVGTTFASNTVTTEESDMVIRGYNAGITKYTTWDSFMPNAPVTRQQAAKMIVMWMSSDANIGVPMTNKQCTFNDEKQIDPSLIAWVRMACQYGLFQGYKGNFMPTNNISTNDIATVVERLSNQSPVIQKYTSMIKIKIENRRLLRGELLKWLYMLDTYVKQEAAREQSSQLDVVQKNVNKAKMLWGKQNLTTYTLTQKASCYCMSEYTRPITYNVIDNSVYTDGAIYADGSGGVATGSMVPKLRTVDDAFAMIQEAIDNKSASITVVYDPILWYPISISIDRSTMIADEEQYFTFTLVQ